MKKIFIVFSSLIFPLLSFAEGGTTTTKGSMGSKKDGCSGFGICKVTTTQDNNAPVTMHWLLNESQTELHMTVSNESLLEVSTEIVDLMDNGLFRMDDAFIFPSDVTDVLGAWGVLTIPTGVYNVTHNEENYIVKFTLE